MRRRSSVQHPGQRREDGPQNASREAVEDERRAETRSSRLLIVLGVIAGIVASVGAFTGVYSLLEIKQTQDNQLAADKKQRVESRARVDQICTIFEGDHKREVNQLVKTYDYLVGLTPEGVEIALADPAGILAPVLKGLPEQEELAALDRAPDFCDQPGEAIEMQHPDRIVGLPEPDPVVPRRPKAVQRLLSR